MTGSERPRDSDSAGGWAWPSAPRRVVVTGMGMLTALGNDVSSSWEGLVAGRSGIGPITAFDPSRLQARIAGEVKDFDASNVLDRKEMRRTDRYIQFGLVASREAMDQAGLPARLEGEEAERTGVILGTGLGGVGTLVDGISINALRGPDRISPFLIPMGIPNVGAGQVAISYGMTGPNFTTASACATGGHAIGEAWETIRRGDADTMIAGGSEAGIYEPLVGGFDSMRALSRRNDDPQAASRPFDQARDGFVPGEGAGVLILEELGHAQERGAPILAEIIGYGATADASHITLPAPGGIGAVRAARRSLAKAGLRPEDIDHVNAHATSTPEGDKSELQAIRTIFGEHADDIPITANKSMVGHTLGAAGAIEAIVTILSIREGCVPPTINLENPDPAAEGLDLTPDRAARHDIEIALSNSFGFGGQNTALIFRRWTS
jgi:3-oxoacyl-[acyl-carrier-protein] synthase II